MPATFAARVSPLAAVPPATLTVAEARFWPSGLATVIPLASTTGDPPCPNVTLPLAFTVGVDSKNRPLGCTPVVVLCWCTSVSEPPPFRLPL